MTGKDKAKKMYENGSKYKDIASTLDISVNTIKSWRTRDKWKRRKKGATKSKKVAPENKKVAKKVASTKLSKQRSTDEKWKTFCLLYLQSYNATQSYMKVYDCDYNTANANSFRLLANDSVKKFIEKIRNEQSNELYITSTDIIKQQMKIAYANLADYVEIKTIKQRREDMDGNPVEDANGNQIIDTYNEIVAKDPSKIDYSLVKSVHKGKDGLVLELYDKQKALSELMKYLPEARDTTAVDPMVNAVKHSLANQIADEDIEKGENK